MLSKNLSKHWKWKMCERVKHVFFVWSGKNAEESQVFMWWFWNFLKSKVHKIDEMSENSVSQVETLFDKIHAIQKSHLT